MTVRASAISKKRVYVVDGDRAASDTLAKTLVTLGYDARLAPSAVALAGTTVPDVNCCVLVDISFTDQSAFGLLQHLHDTDADVGVVFMTARADISMAVTAMKRGAIDFLVKPLRMSELLPAVEAALLHSAQRRDVRLRRAQFSARAARLTPREREVLALVLEGKRNKQIADALASRESTVKVHRSRLMRKLETQTLAELLRMSAELGGNGATTWTTAPHHRAVHRDAPAKRRAQGIVPHPVIP